MNNTIAGIPQFVAAFLSPVSTRGFNKIAKLFQDTFNKELVLGSQGRIKIIHEELLAEQDKEKYYMFLYGYSLAKGIMIKPL